MKNRGIHLFSTIAFLLLIGACTTAPNYTTIEDLKIRLTTNPNPPITGDGNLVIYLTKSNGDMVDGVKVVVSVTASGMKTGIQNGLAIRQSPGIFAYPLKFHMQSSYDVHLWVYRNDTVVAVQESTISL